MIAGDMVMKHQTGDIELLVPGIMLLPMSNISFSGLALNVLKANPTEEVLRHVMQHLWTEVINKVFHFEFDGLKIRKVDEVMLSHRSGSHNMRS